jgi:GT2 family glycosyltransferase
MKKLTISIVNYNAGEYLIKCLDSLRRASKALEFDVYVVDNASSDGSIEMAQKEFPEVNFIKNKENLGFGKAHNLVLKNAKTPYLLVLNPDCEVPSGTLEYMYDFMEKNPNVGLSTCEIVKSDGTLDKAAHRGFPTPWQSFLYLFFKKDKHYHMTNVDMTTAHEIDSAVGAFMFVRKSVLDKVGYFDEDYFLYGEDIDLCYRIKENGFKIMYVPEVKILHVKGVSSGIKEHSRNLSAADTQTKNSSVQYFYGTMKTFYKKHYAKKYPFFINWAAYMAIDLKKYMAKRKKSV